MIHASAIKYIPSLYINTDVSVLTYICFLQLFFHKFFKNILLWAPLKTAFFRILAIKKSGFIIDIVPTREHPIR
jgi:hypothetical protein